MAILINHTLCQSHLLQILEKKIQLPYLRVVKALINRLNFRGVSSNAKFYNALGATEIIPV